jgi:hypothetical protein
MNKQTKGRADGLMKWTNDFITAKILEKYWKQQMSNLRIQLFPREGVGLKILKTSLFMSEILLKNQKFNSKSFFKLRYAKINCFPLLMKLFDVIKIEENLIDFYNANTCRCTERMNEKCESWTDSSISQRF